MDAMYFYLTGDGEIIHKSADTANSCHVKMISVSRMREMNTGKEKLAIELFDQDNGLPPYAMVYCSPLTLQDDINKLADYGFIAQRKEAMKTAKMILSRYYELNCTTIEGARTIEADMPDILRHICRYIIRENIKSITIGNYELYNIKVGDFEPLIKNSIFRCYRQRDIKRMLRDCGYAVSSTGRLENTIAEGGKVISIHANDTEIIEIMQELLIETMAEHVHG